MDTCLVSTGDGVLRLPWVEVVYPKFICNPQGEELGEPGSPSQLSSSGMRAGRGSAGGSGGGLGWGSSSGELDSWSWDEEEDDDDGNDPDGTEGEAALVALARRRASEDALAGRLRAPSSSSSSAAAVGDREGDYVELLEPRGGPDGGADPSQQRYLEMHGISKTRTLPLCRRSKAIKLRRGKAWAFGRTDGGTGGRSAAGGRRDSSGHAGRDWMQSRPMPRVIDLGRERRNHPAQDLDVEERYVRDPTGLESRGLYLEGQAKERRPGVGREREGAACTLPWEESQRCKGSASSRSGSVAQRMEEEEETKVTNHKGEHTGEGQSDPDQGSHSDSVFEDTDKQLADSLSSEECPSTPLAETLVSPVYPDNPLADTCEEGKSVAGQVAAGSECCNSARRGTPPQTGNTKENSDSERTHSQPGTDKVTGEKHCGKSEDRVCPRGKEVKSVGFRAPRYG